MIEATGLTHYYGPHPAIQDVNFGVEKGEILGFLGPNGAGKTTTMRILTGFMPPTRGKVSLDGFDVVDQSLEVRKKIGYLPETVPLYTAMNVSSYLTYMGTLRGMPTRDIKRRIGDVIDVCRLGDYQKTIIGKLSKGFRQRVGVAQAILHEPEVLVLAEPTIGIDPIQVVETRRLIQDLGKAQTVVLSSHILPEVSMICERVMIINEGQIEELFRDYYRNRDNSILQLVFLLFSKAKMTSDENKDVYEKMLDTTTESIEEFIKNSSKDKILQ